MTAAYIDDRVVGWRNARRYGVPASTVAAASKRRAAGDWAGACAAAQVEVRFRLANVRDRFGAELTAALEDDLRHLVPDLLRWHLPRQAQTDHGPLEPGRLTLARYGPEPARPLTLAANVPGPLSRPHRIELYALAYPALASMMDDWSDTRDLWDDRATSGLLPRMSGGDRTPFFTSDGRALGADELPRDTPTGDPVALTEWVMLLQESGRFEEAWTAGGVPAQFLNPFTRRPMDLERWTYGWDAYALVPALAVAVQRWRARSSSADDRIVVLRPFGSRFHRLVVTVSGSDMSAALAADVEALPVAPRSWWNRLPEIELLRRRGLELPGVHPLVRASLFPDYPGDPDEFRPVDPAQPGPVRVRCRGGWHRVGWRDGRAEAFDHTAEEARRERVVRSLGGEVPRCFTVTEGWRRGDRLPRELRGLRRHGVLAARHGDATELIRLLDLGLDPAGLRDRWGRDPMHHLALLQSLPLLRRLLAAGLDINRRDLIGRTPLAWAVCDGGPADLVHALLDAGADPTIADDNRDTVLHLLRSTGAAAFLPRLLAAGLDLEARNHGGRTPLLLQVMWHGPAAAIRALWEAGADPHAQRFDGDKTVLDMVRDGRRADLHFLFNPRPSPPEVRS
jgi:hypothetical protein